MKKGILRLLSILVSVFMLVGAVGCGEVKNGTQTTPVNQESKTDNTASASPAAKDGIDLSKKVEVIMYLAGDAPADMPLVEAELSKNMEKDLNCTLKIIHIPWADWETKYRMIITAGEKYDLIYSSNWADFRNFGAQGAFMALDDLLPKYAPDILNQVDKAGWDEVTLNGKIVGIPARQKAYVTDCWVIRGDYREKFGVPEVTDFDSMEVYLDAVKKNVPDVIPWNAASTDKQQFLSESSYEFIPGTDAGRDMHMFINSYDNLEEVKLLVMEPEYEEFIKRMKRWGDKGFWSKSVLTNEVLSKDCFIDGKTAVASCNTGQARGIIKRVNMIHPEWKPEFVCFRDKVKAGVHPMVWMADGMAVGRNSQNPERALMALNKIRSDRACYDLLFYGIEGKHYVLTSDGKTKLPDGLTEDKNGYPVDAAGQWGITVEEFKRYDVNEWMPYYTEVFKTFDTYATPDKMATFTFKRDAVQSEMAAITQIMSQYGLSLQWGKVDPEKGLKDLREKLKNAGNVDKVLAEVNKQVKEYLGK